MTAPALGAGEEYDSPRHFVRLQPSADGRPLEEGGEGGAAPVAALGHRRFGRSGADGVDGHALGSPFEGHRLGESGDSALGGDVDRSVDGRRDGQLRRHVDDPAVPVGEHVARRRLSREERALQVDGVDGVPKLLGHVQHAHRGADAGVVDQDIEAPQVRGDGVEHPPDLADLRHVQVVPAGSAACGLDLADKLVDVGPFRWEVGDGDRRSGLGERDADGFADALAPAGDDGDPAVQSERRLAHRRRIIGFAAWERHPIRPVIRKTCQKMPVGEDTVRTTSGHGSG